MVGVVSMVTVEEVMVVVFMIVKFMMMKDGNAENGG